MPVAAALALARVARPVQLDFHKGRCCKSSHILPCTGAGCPPSLPCLAPLHHACPPPALHPLGGCHGDLYKGWGCLHGNLHGAKVTHNPLPVFMNVSSMQSWWAGLCQGRRGQCQFIFPTFSFLPSPCRTCWLGSTAPLPITRLLCPCPAQCRSPCSALPCPPPAASPMPCKWLLCPLSSSAIAGVGVLIAPLLLSALFMRSEGF